MLIGHQKQWEYLVKSMKQGKIPQALLFSGEQNLGKNFVALEFVKLLNCEHPNNNKPCQVCKNCQSITKKIHPDLTIIEPIEKEIQISQIRELNARLALHSLSQGFKAIIIDNADTMNQEAQNALLKLLEEPRGKTVFILIAEHQNKLFSTILSRTQILKFYPVSQMEIEKFLLTRLRSCGSYGGRGKISANQIQEILSFSYGRPGRAINFLLHPQEIEIEKQRIKQIQELIDSDIAFRFQYAKQISENRDELKQILELWTRYFRAILIEKLTPQCHPELPSCHPEPWRRTPSNNHENFPRDPSAEPQGDGVGNYSLAKLKKILDTIQKTQFLLSTTNVNSKLALELLMLEI